MNKQNCNPVDGCGQPNIMFRPFMRVEDELGPYNTIPPVVSGTLEVGENLTVTNGTWTGAVSYARQWTRNGVAILGATSNTYTLVAADETKRIAAIVTATNTYGNASSLSNTVGPILP